MVLEMERRIQESMVKQQMANTTLGALNAQKAYSETPSKDPVLLNLRIYKALNDGFVIDIGSDIYIAKELADVGGILATHITAKRLLK